MRSHPERSRDAYNARKDLGLSPRARFCTVIKQGSLVIEIYSGDIQIDALSGRAASIALNTDWAVSIDKLDRGEYYSAAVQVKGGEVEERRHGIDDGIVCTSPVKTA